MILLLLILLFVPLFIGLSSLAFFLYLLASGAAGKGFIIIDVIVVVLLGIALFYVKRLITHSVALGPPVSQPQDAIYKIIPPIFYTALISAVTFFIFLSLTNPHGVWDAYSIWNVRARLLFRGGTQWLGTFTDLLARSHPDYPLLIPAAIARCWKYISGEAAIVPILMAMFFTFATVGLVACAVSMFRSKPVGLLAGLILLCTPSFIELGTSQYADVPLSFFILATIVLLAFQNRTQQKSNALLILAGMTAGLAGWTKNEGLLFIIAVLAGSLIATVPSKGWRAYFREMRPFAAGLAPILTIILYFKIKIAPSNDLISVKLLPSIMERLAEFPSYLMVLKGFLFGVFYFDNSLVSIVLVLIVGLILTGVKIRSNEKPIIAVSLAILSIALIGYFFAYVITPYGIEYHMRTSLGRLLGQVWPGFIFIYFLLIRFPER